MNAKPSLFRQPGFHLFVLFLFASLMGWPMIGSFSGAELHVVFLFLYVLWTVLIILLFFIHLALGRRRNNTLEPGYDEEADV